MTCFDGRRLPARKDWLAGWLAGPGRPLFSRMLRLPSVEPIVGPSSCNLSNTKREDEWSSFLLYHDIVRWLTSKVLSHLLGSIDIGWRVEIGHVLR